MATQSDVRLDQLVTFRVDQEEMAIPIQYVQEIVKLPGITRIPKAPSYIDGMGNLRGELLPIINLRRRLGMESRAHDEFMRVVVVNSCGTRTGFIVDGVSEVLTVDERLLEVPPPSFATIDGQFLRSVAKVNQGRRLILILDEARILPETVQNQNNLTAVLATQDDATIQATLEEQEQVVSFRVGNEEYAVNIDAVKEIIRIRDITPLPQTPHFVLGVMSLRSHLLPVIDLATRFLGPSTHSHSQRVASHDNHRVVVLELQGFQIGVRVDAVSQVLRIDKSMIDSPPSVSSRRPDDALIGVGKLNDGKRLLLVLDAHKLIPEDVKHRLNQNREGAQVDAAKKVQTGNEEEVKFVCFSVDHEEYALDIMKVQEIIRLRDITRLPQAPDYVGGIINLRGILVPVIDMRVRFGLQKSERADENRIVITMIQGKVTGLIVDSVSEVIRLQKSQIEPPPPVVSGVESRFIEGIAKVNNGKRMLILILLEALLDEQIHQAA